MNIAILGWGSLIWNPEGLNYNKEKDWDIEGPVLPLEFARISQNGRLTIVITPEGNEVKTLYAFSNENSLDNAIENLRVREGTTIRNIGYYDNKDKIFHSENFHFKENIINWIKDKDIDSIIWTNLCSNWKEKTDNRIEYLRSLEDEQQKEAKKYIINAPKQIQTYLRKQIEIELNWV